MSLEEKIGQLLMVGFTGTEPSGAVRRLIADRHVGGVILFYRNIRDGNHLGELTAALQECAAGPLLLSADQEGGSVLRVRQGATLIPSAMGLGRLGVEGVREAARICGEEMRAMGLNLNLAPVLDINTPDNPGIGIRAYGEAPDQVARLGEACVQGLQGAGVLACVKHFPGKGAARLDAHLDLPVIEQDIGLLESFELVPFKAAFAAGAAAAMTSHCVYPRLDAKPATLSGAVLTDLLRRRLGFEGILITDDMEMGAISKYHQGRAAAVAAFAAGADVILICHDHDLQEAALDAIAAALEAGDIPMSRLDESVARIIRAKKRIGPAPGRSLGELVGPNGSRVQELCDRIAHVARDPGRLLPLAGQEVSVCWPAMGTLTKVEEGTVGEELARERFSSRFGRVRFSSYDPREPSVPVPAPASTVVFFSANAHLFPAQAQLIRTLAAGAGRFVLVCLRNPYDQDVAPPSSTVVQSYGFLPNQLKSALDLVLGSRG